MLAVAVLISGRGSNLQALLDAFADSPVARLALVLSNRADAYGLQRAQAAGVPTAVVRHRDYETREAFEAAMQAELEAAGAELVCLAGFMRLLTSGFVERWWGRLVNIHPSLLPAFKGLDVHARVVEAGVRFTGCTVHFVSADMDAGPIIGQAVVPVLPGDDADAVAARVLEAEHALYPRVVQAIAEGRVSLEGRRVQVEADLAAGPPLLSL